MGEGGGAGGGEGYWGGGARKRHWGGGGVAHRRAVGHGTEVTHEAWPWGQNVSGTHVAGQSRAHTGHRDSRTAG